MLAMAAFRAKNYKDGILLFLQIFPVKGSAVRRFIKRELGNGWILQVRRLLSAESIWQKADAEIKTAAQKINKFLHVKFFYKAMEKFRL